MRNKRKLLLEQLDNKLGGVTSLGKIIMPEKGWINAIRTTLNMTMEQLGDRLATSKQRVKKIEDSEVSGSLTLSSMKEVAEAMDLKFVYGFVPKDGSFENLVDRKANELAKRIVLRTNQNMKLEDQGIEDEKLKQSIQELAAEIKREMKRALWD